MSSAVVFSEDDIVEHVGSVETLKRGIVYAKSGLVFDLETRDNALHARIGGGAAEPYRAWVTFAVGQRKVAVAFCGCVEGGQGQCKHIAAMLYAFNRHLDVDPTLMKRMAANSSSAHHVDTKSKTPTKRELPRRARASTAAAVVHMPTTAATVRPVTIDCESQDIEIPIRGERVDRVVSAIVDDLPPAGLLGPSTRASNRFNRALSDVLHSSQVSSTDSAAAAAAAAAAAQQAKPEPVYTTLESFNAMQAEIKQLRVLLRWTRIASEARVQRLKERCAALERESALSRAQLPRQLSSDDYDHNNNTQPLQMHDRDTVPTRPAPPKRKAVDEQSATATTATATTATATTKQRRTSPSSKAKAKVNVRPEYRAWDEDDDEEW
jgi:hypothetical protein